MAASHRPRQGLAIGHASIEDSYTESKGSILVDRQTPRKGPRWFELMLAGRLLRSRRSVHLSLVTSMSIAGIALGVAALIVVLAVNTGFQAAFQDRILATYPHVVVMRRGVDLNDWREVVERVQKVSGVVVAAPATYDDMMLSAAAGRAGAIVRGVTPEVLGNLPPGALVQGKLVQTGEMPKFSWNDAVLSVKSGVAAARHAFVVTGPTVQVVPMLTIGAGVGTIEVFDTQGCSSAKNDERDQTGEFYLINPDTGDVVRRALRGHCRIDAHWEIGPGRWQMRWQDGAGVQQDTYIDLGNGGTALAVLDRARVVVLPGPDPELESAVAAVAVVNLTQVPVRLQTPEQVDQTVAEVSQWQAFSAQLPAIALGEGLAKRLQVHVGEEVRAVSPTRGMDRGTEASTSSSGRFRVSAILRTGFHDHDQRLALVDFHAAQRFLGRGDIARWVEIRVKDPILASSQTDAFRAALEPTDLGDLMLGAGELHKKLLEIQHGTVTGLELQPPNHAVAVVDNWISGVRAARSVRVRTGNVWRVIDWEEMNRNIFDAARMQKVAMSLFPFIIVLVAALNVVGTQAVVVHERARDIAILRAMGATRRSVAAIFLLQGLTVGILGTLLGLGVGGLCCLLLDAVGYPLDPQVYLISRLPVVVEPMSFVLAGGAAIVLAFAAAWYAAQRAASRAPVDALRRLD